MQPTDRELGSGGFDVPAITRLAIDQVVVDGLVDGSERRVPFGTLAGNAFHGARVPSAVFGDFRRALPEDVRFLGRVGRKYSYNPVIHGETEAVARPEAVVSERGMYSEERFKAAMERMDGYVNAIYQSTDKSRVIMNEGTSEGTLARILRSAGIGVPEDEFDGLYAYIERDDARLRVIGDGRLVLVDRYEGDVEEIPELPRIENFTSLIDEALPLVAMPNSGRLRPAVVMDAIKSIRGTEVRPDQIRKLIDKLHTHPSIKFLDKGVFKLIGQAADATATEPPRDRPKPEKPRPQPEAPQESLDDMMNTAFDGNPTAGRTKHRPRRRDEYR